MIFTSNNDHKLYDNFEIMGLKNVIKNNDVLIKINLSGTYQKNHPRTDMTLLKKVVTYIYSNGGKCAIAEGSSRCITENLAASGFGETIKKFDVKVINVDLLDEYEKVESYGECHYIPKCFQKYPVRVAIPAASKRKDMLYSNNIKLFVGAVPRRMYQLDDSDVTSGVPRPKLHQNLHLSVANLFLAIKKYSEFQFYINGGLAYNENIGEFILADTFVGNNALELDLHIFHTFFNDCEYPEYLDILKARISK